MEAGLGKAEVREAARALGLPTWDKPASACLSSRIAFGVRITVDELRKVGRAERLLKDLGFRQVRVRVHDDLARVEVEAGDVPRLTDPEVRARVVAALKDLGYRYVTVDLEGFRSGSMNCFSSLVPKSFVSRTDRSTSDRERSITVPSDCRSKSVLFENKPGPVDRTGLSRSTLDVLTTG